MSAVEYKVLTPKPVLPPHTNADDNRIDSEAKAPTKVIYGRVSTIELCRLARQLATLLRAGMPLVQALSALVEQAQEPRTTFDNKVQNEGKSKRRIICFAPRQNSLALIMEEVCNNVNTGSSLSCALSKHHGVFSNLFVNMVAAGEASGNLEDVLFRLAEMLSKRVHLAGKIKSAIAYPLMMAVVAVGVVVFLLSFVVPDVTQLFLEMNRSLPWPTRLLIAISGFMETYWILIPIVVCIAFFGISGWIRTKEGRMIWDRSKLRIPLFGNLFLKLEIARLSRTLSILLQSGIPILSALEIVKGVIQNVFIAGALETVKDFVGRGDHIAGAIKRTGLFPPIVFHTLATGQISGNIEDGLIDIADMYDDEVELTSKTLTSLLEPAILLVMGAIIGFIVLAVLLPIFEINQIL